MVVRHPLSLSAGFTSCSEDTQTAVRYSDWQHAQRCLYRLYHSFCTNPPTETLGKSIELVAQSDASERIWAMRTTLQGKTIMCI